MNHLNYQKVMEEIIEHECRDGANVSVMLHSCCAPCSSYCLSFLSEHFEIWDLFYNPNITPKDEYEKRYNELERLVSEEEMGKLFAHPVHLLEGRYEPEEFFEMARGLENVPEGGERCFRCYRMRLEEAAKMAALYHTDYFATTLTISPLKNAEKINEIGFEMEKKYGVKYLPSDFKKKDGYRKSCQLSEEYQLYRQNYCGCVFSKREREAALKEKETEKL